MAALAHIALAAGALATAFTVGGQTRPDEAARAGGGTGTPSGRALPADPVPVAGPASWPFGRQPPAGRQPLPVGAGSGEAARLQIARQEPVAPPLAVAPAVRPPLAVAEAIRAPLAVAPTIPAPRAVAARPALPQPVPPPPGDGAPVLSAWIQLAAYRQPVQAGVGWRLLAARYPDLLGELNPGVVLARPRPDEGVFYRLLAGPFPTGHAARARCITLARAGRSGCLVRRPGDPPAWPPQRVPTPDPTPRLGAAGS